MGAHHQGLLPLDSREPRPVAVSTLPDIWEFRIGGYQVCEKWLKDRRGRKLSDEDILHYRRAVAALKETIRMMGEIDEVIEAYCGWPLPGSVREDRND